MSWLVIVLFGAVVYGAVVVSVVSAVRFATGGRFPSPRSGEVVSCSNF